jgi:hypothetical protein
LLWKVRSHTQRTAERVAANIQVASLVVCLSLCPPWQAISCRLLAGTGSLFLLHWRTFVVAIGAKHTAILSLGPQEHAAVRASIEELTCINWHRFCLGKLAVRTGNRRLCLHMCPYATRSKKVMRLLSGSMTPNSRVPQSVLLIWAFGWMTLRCCKRVYSCVLMKDGKPPIVMPHREAKDITVERNAKFYIAHW